MCCHFSHVQLFATPWTITLQVPLPLGFFRQEGWHLLLQGVFLTQGSNLHLLRLLHTRQRLSCWTLPSWFFLRPLPRWFSCYGSPGRNLCTFAITTACPFPHKSILWRLNSMPERKEYWWAAEKNCFALLGFIHIWAKRINWNSVDATLSQISI